MKKKRIGIISLGIVIVSLILFSYWNSKNIIMSCYTTSDNSSDRAEVILKASFIEFPFGLIYFDGVLDYKNHIYESSSKFLLSKKALLNELEYEIVFKDFVTSQSTQTVIFSVQNDVFHSNLGTIFLLHREIATLGGKVTSNSYACTIEELLIQ